jgi:hypothetical protein
MQIPPAAPCAPQAAPPVPAAAPPPPAAAPRAPARAPLRDISNQPLITGYLAAGSEYKPRAVQQSLHEYFKIG